MRKDGHEHRAALGAYAEALNAYAEAVLGEGQAASDDVK